MKKALKTEARTVATSRPLEDLSSLGEIGRDIEVANGEIPNASSAQFVLIRGADGRVNGQRREGSKRI
jgi:hypothetical protein